MISLSLVVLASILAGLAIFVYRARPQSTINRWFAAYTSVVTAWTLAIAGAYSGYHTEQWGRLMFASASLIPTAFLAFSRQFPTLSRFPSTTGLMVTFAAGVLFAALSLGTTYIAYDFSLLNEELTRRAGSLYPLFGLYFLAAWTGAMSVLIHNCWTSRDLPRAQLRYLNAGIILSGVLAITTNLLFPLVSGRSTYSWLGPYFGVLLIALVAHGIIRHRLMELRLVVHRGLTFAAAMMMSLLPVLFLLAAFWPHLSDRLTSKELAILLVAVCGLTLLVPLTRDIAGRLLDKYVYRIQPDYRKTVRRNSRALTRVLDRRVILSLVSESVGISVEPEAIALYLLTDEDFVSVFSHKRHGSTRFTAPEIAPQVVITAISQTKDLLLSDDLARQRTDDSDRRLHFQLEELNWAVVLPLLSEDVVIGAIAVAPKRSGDPFYPNDLDLLMTLAHQAGIAIKNAQLYTQVVLANEYIENIVGTIESGVVATDAGGRVMMFNRAAEQLTGLGAEVVKQEAEALPADLTTLLRATLGDGVKRTEPEIALPDGTTTRPVICTTSPLRDPAGAILGAVAVFSDLTPFKQLENERRRAERLAYFEILASSLAHEIKNPLVAIKTFSQLIPRRHKDEHFVAEFSRVVTREINRMERLVERLRALSRPSDGRRKPVDLRDPVCQAVEFLRPAFAEKRIAIALAPGDKAAMVLGDANELEQLFINLLMNAHEATPPEGTVSAEISVGGTNVAVAIADSGPGIPSEVLEHVFDPFITTKPRGSGLGLTISAGIAATHRAKLWATNRPGGGALFQVEFPIAIPTEATREIPGTGMSACA